MADEQMSDYHHQATEGIQYEFYIPKVIWSHPATKRFFNRVASLESGATVSPNLLGLWQSQAEQVHVVRVMAMNIADRAQARALLLREIGELMAQLEPDAAARQEEILFTEYAFVAVQVRRDSGGGSVA